MSAQGEISRQRRQWVVITTINEPTDAVVELLELLGDDWRFVIVGDRKTPQLWETMDVEFLSLARQRDLFPRFADVAPIDHYCRKNLGYLFAMKEGAAAILETDDDNHPYGDFGSSPGCTLRGPLVGGGGWVNIYLSFTQARIWPRGLPLDAISARGTLHGEPLLCSCPIQQYLVDEDPDVDAIYRLVFPERNFRFERTPETVVVDSHTWVPFNSQNTLFFPEAFPLLYLPHHVSFRMTDIWRSFVAQAALWHGGHRLAFHRPTARQQRNLHDLNRDFADEVPGYLQNRKIGRILLSQLDAMPQGLPLLDVATRLWLALIEQGIVPSAETILVEQWAETVASLTNQSATP